MTVDMFAPLPPPGEATVETLTRHVLVRAQADLVRIDHLLDGDGPIHAREAAAVADAVAARYGMVRALRRLADIDGETADHIAREIAAELAGDGAGAADAVWMWLHVLDVDPEAVRAAAEAHLTAAGPVDCEVFGD